MVLAMLLPLAASFVFSQPPNAAGKTVLGGTYTAAQAQRGQISYERNCASCHKADLSGFSGPPLKGDLFMDRWREFNLDVLFDLIKNTMPQAAPGTLTEGMYLDLLAYMLQANGLPAGAKELIAESLSSTLLVGKDGPQPLPSSAQVDLVGCFTEDSGNGWFLTSASEPVRTLDTFQITPEELNGAKAKPLGKLVFRLENLSDLNDFSPPNSIGQKLEAKGILVRQVKGNRINVTALRSVAATCEP